MRGEFLTRYVGRMNRRPAPKTLAEVERALSADVFSAWIDRPLVSITERDVLSVLLSMAELAAVWRAAEVALANHGDTYQSIVRLLLLTGQRREEDGPFGAQD